MACTNTKHHNMTTRFCPDCGEQLVHPPLRIQYRDQLSEVAELLGVRPDWHEPDEQDVTAHIFGKSFDNAGFWPYNPTQPEDRCCGSLDSEGLEMYVELRQADKPIAHVNLATLFAFACGYSG